MKNLINGQNLENLLIANWAKFLDFKQIIAFTLNCVRDNKDSLQTVLEDELPEKNVQVTISRFELYPDGFVIWIDYTVPYENTIAVGTVESKLNLNGELIPLNTIGTLFVCGN